MSVDRRRFTLGCCSCTALTLLAGASRAADPGTTFLAPRYQPPADSDERGLWSIMARAERELSSSRFVVHDRAVGRYVDEIVCRLGADHCDDVRSYVVRTPLFNASMAPNGMMQVWTGLLLRCSDEAQLAGIVGHELGHYLRRHTVDRWRDARAKADFGAFLSLGLAAVGIGLAGIAANLALLASAFAYTRDQEREADDIGLRLMADAGYAPVAAAEVWDQLVAEQKLSTGSGTESIFFASHPDPEERLATMRRLAGERGGAAGERGVERHREALRELRPLLVADELRLRQYARSEAVFDRLLGVAGDDGLLWYAKGEVCRLRGNDGDNGLALAAYRRAEQATGAPAEMYRSMALVDVKLDDRAGAARAFARYVELKPDASDRDALQSLISP